MGKRPFKVCLFNQSIDSPITNFWEHRYLQGKIPSIMSTKPTNSATILLCNHLIYLIILLLSQLGSGMLNLELVPEIKEFQDLSLRLVGVFSKNREEWLLLDYANVLYGMTMIPIYDTLGN